LPLSVPLEALRIANATVDILEGAATRVSLSFATHLSGEVSGDAPTISSSDAVLIARDLLAAISAMATAFTVTPMGDASPPLRQVFANPRLKEAVERSFTSALEVSLPVTGHDMIVNAWSAMMGAFLRGAHLPPSA
jgi:hypothetical protein